MSSERGRAGRRVLRVVVAVVAVLALVIVGVVAWASTVMMGERPAALRAWEDPQVSTEPLGDGPADAFRIGTVITPQDASGEGLVFLPGAKVDPTAYLWKLSGVAAATGLTIVVPHLRLNLAFFDTRPVTAYTDLVPGVERWYVGGHSLGGVRACQLAGGSDAADAAVIGVMLFGSYCANDLSGTDLRALTLAGEFDGLSTPADIAANAGNLPGDAVVVVLEGLNHAAFGDYGVQPGDGTATVTSDRARAEIAEATGAFVGASDR